jgi:hypothetical protein
MDEAAMMKRPEGMSAWQQLERTMLFKAFLILIYLSSNISLNMLNKVLGVACMISTCPPRMP